MKFGQPNPEEYKVYVFVQSYNRKALLETSISSFQSVLGNDSRFQLCIYDAGSSDGSIEYLNAFQNEFGTISFFVSKPSKLSFSAGHNRLLREIDTVEKHNAFVLFFETDNAILDRKAIDKAIDVTQSGAADAVGFTPLKYDGSKAGYGGAFPKKSEFIIGQRATKWLCKKPSTQDRRKQEVFETEVAFTSPLLVRLDLLKSVGGFDERNFPFGHSDTDLCKRIYKAGGRILVLRSSSFIHDNLDQASEWSNTRVRDYHRATFRLLEKHDGSFSIVDRLSLIGRHAIELLVLGGLAIFSSVYRKKLVGRFELLRRCWNGYDFL